MSNQDKNHPGSNGLEANLSGNDHPDTAPHDLEAQALAGDSGNEGARAQMNAEQEEHEAALREELLAKRRERQLGSKTKSTVQKMKTGVAGLFAAGILLGVIVGPSKSLDLLGLTDPEGDEKSSNVNMTVDIERNSKEHRLDVGGVVPGEPIVKEDRSGERKALEQRFEEMEALLKNFDAEAAKKMKASLADQEKKLAETLKKEREAMDAENKKLRDEARKREEDDKRKAEAQRMLDEEIKRLEEIENKQRQSSSIVTDDSEGAAPGGASGTVPFLAGGAAGGNQQFLASAAASEFQTSVSKPLANPSKTVVQGTIISAVLETAINTELPGNIRAQVSEPVFSYDGKRILMPAGTVLIGTFNPDIMVAQKRVLIAWNRAITPKGQSIAIGSTGTDTLGRAGTAGNVDNRLMPKIGAAVLVTTINAVPSLIGGLFNKGSSQQQSPSPVTVNVGGGQGSNAGSQAVQGAAGAVAEQTGGFLEKYLSLPPIIRVPQGEEIRVFVNRDLVFR